MRLSKMFMPTQREIPSEAEIISHQLMLRAGLMRKIASGIYSYLPMGYRTYRKIENIVREEMDKAEAQELIMPAILPAEVYMQSGRWEVFGPEMFRLRDRNNREFCLGPTHEEPFTETVRNSVKSYRSLPITLYQIQHKYRDEKRPRFGVMRSREFVMKDAYSFDRDEAGLDISYKAMAKAYCAIFDRCGLDYIVVDADSGAMGGSGSQEYMVKSVVGESGISFCNSCGYAANDEKAPCVSNIDTDGESMITIEKIHTPNIKTIEELKNFSGLNPEKFIKSLLYSADGNFVLAMVSGDRDINETKLANLLGCNELTLAGAADIREVTGADVGFTGPVGLKKKIEIICDIQASNVKNIIVGANDTDYHYKNVNAGVDFTPTRIEDIRTIRKDDPCPVCNTPVDVCRGIEVGHIFKLGTKYSKTLECNYLNEEGNENHMVMGCYGIGLNRTMAAVIEQNYDENGIIWPVSVAPYHVMVVPIMVNDAKQMEIAEYIYDKLKIQNVEVLIDDRDERAGVKFKDSDLIGIPFRITCGRKVGDNIVEFKSRAGKENIELSPDEAIEKILQLLAIN